MALVVADRVFESSTTSGTGTLNLAGAVSGYRTFVSGVGSGNTTYYTIYDSTAFVWEVGIGTVTSGSPNTLSRTTVLSNSSGTTSPINLAGNTVNVWCDYPAAKALYTDASGNAIALGTPASGALSNCTVDGTNGVGYINIPQNAQTGNYTLVAADAGKHIYHAAAAAAAIYTIPANGSVPYIVGTAITFVNLSTNAVTISITTDTLYLAGAGTTGNRTLAQYGTATALKVTSTAWIISGAGLS